MLSTSEASRLIVSLKAKLLFRGDGWQAALTVIGMFFGLAAGLGAAAFLWFNADLADRATVAMLMLSFISITWPIGSIVVGGGESVLDPSRFALLPLSTRNLCVAFFAAAFVGVFGPVSVLIALSALRYAPSFGAGVIMLLAGIVTVCTAVVSGRAAVALMSGMVRGRRTREVAAGVAAMFGVFIGFVPQVLIVTIDQLTADVRETVRSIARWVPWGWAPESLALAAEGRFWLSLAWLLGAAALLIGISALWVRTVAEIMVTREASHASGIDSELVPASMGRLPDVPAVAVWARTLRQLRRDPREYAQLAGFLPLLLVAGLPSFDLIRNREPDIVLGSGALGLMFGLTAQSLFATDGRSFGVDALALGDITPVVIGKALARVTLGVPVILLVAVALSAWTGGWSRLFAGVAIGVVGLLSMAAVGMNTSVRYAQPMPEKVGAFNTQNNSQGCAAAVVAILSLVVAFVVAMVGIVPISLLTIFVSPVAGSAFAVLALVYAVVVFRMGATMAGRWANQHLPEMFQKLATPV